MTLRGHGDLLYGHPHTETGQPRHQIVVADILIFTFELFVEIFTKSGQSLGEALSQAHRDIEIARLQVALMEHHSRPHQFSHLILLVPCSWVSAFVSRQTSSGDSDGYNTEHTGNHEVYQRAHTYRTRTNELPRDTYTRPSMYAVVVVVVLVDIVVSLQLGRALVIEDHGTWGRPELRSGRMSSTWVNKKVY